jgi:hypothetical protein
MRNTRRCGTWFEPARRPSRISCGRGPGTSKFLLRHGRRVPAGLKVWTRRYQDRVKEQVHFEQPAQEFTLLDYLPEVEPMADRIRRLEKAIKGYRREKNMEVGRVAVERHTARRILISFYAAGLAAGPAFLV